MDTVAARADAAPEADPYRDALMAIDRLHRLMSDLVKDALAEAGVEDLSSTQAMMLHAIGADELSAGDLKARGRYLGSNLSYNLKKLDESGHIHYARCDEDRRSVRVRLTAKGREICDLVARRRRANAARLRADDACSPERLRAAVETLGAMERRWRGEIRHIY